MNQSDACSHGSGLTMRLMHLAHRLNSAAGKQFFAPYGLTMSTGRMLIYLHHSDGKTPTELTMMVGSKKSNTTQRISLLKKAGLVELKQSTEGDRRNIRIFITEKGKELALTIEKIFDEHVKLLENVLTKEQKEQTLSVLNLLCQTVDDFERSHT